jgi:hypothetical protein
VTLSEFPSRNGCTFAAEKGTKKRKEQNHENRKSNNPRSDSPGAGNACRGTALAQWRTRWRQPRRLVDERPQPQQRPLAQQFELQLVKPQLQLTQPQYEHIAQLQQLAGDEELAEPQLQRPEPQQLKRLEPQYRQLEHAEP